jgi:hypothetical protein
MLKLYTKLKVIAESEYNNIITSTKIIGKRSVGSVKLRIFFKDKTFLDIWLSPSGKYSYHWEQRPQRGRIYRYDNAPDFPHIKTHPHHIHNGDEKTIYPSYIDTNPLVAIREILNAIKQKLEQ